jgi:hypothetical protein
VRHLGSYLVFTSPPALPGAPTNLGIMVIKRRRSVNAPVATVLKPAVGGLWHDRVSWKPFSQLNINAPTCEPFSDGCAEIWQAYEP